MAVQYSVPSGAVTLTAATARTCVELATTANLPVELIALDVSSSYLTSATPVDLLIELVAFTVTGTGTTYVSRKYGQGTGTSYTTAKIADTVEPSTPTVIYAWRMPLPGGHW